MGCVGIRVCSKVGCSALYGPSILYRSQDVKAKMQSRDEKDAPFQEGYKGDLTKLHSAVRSGRMRMPSREELGEMLRSHC